MRVKKLGKPNLDELRQSVKNYEFPTDILVETVALCNLKCIMCPQSRLTRKKGEMSFDLWKKIIDEIAEKNPETKLWPAIMGEPLLLGEKIFWMIKYGKDRGIQHISLNTNLMAFTENMMPALFESRLDEIIISIDGFTAKTYEKIRLGGKLETVLNNINAIIAEKERRKLLNPIVTLQYVVMDENEHEQEMFVDFWQKSGKNILLKMKPRGGWGDGANAWTNIRNFSQKERFIPCMWLLRHLPIFWNGDVPQCDGDWDGRTIHGNVKESSIEEIWNRLRIIRDRHMKLDFNFPPCNMCDDWQAGRSLFIECRDGAKGTDADLLL